VALPTEARLESSVASNRIHWSCLAVLVLAAAGTAAAQGPVPDLNGYVTLASGYWKHGLSQNDGLSAQIGIDYQHHSGFFVGAWAANVEFEREYSTEQPRDVEANAYVGYHRRNPEWSWTLGLGRYAYPGAATQYAYDELSATVGFRDRVFYTASYSDEYGATARSSLNQELSVAFPLRGNVEIGAALGHFSVERGGPDITHWNVGVSKLVRRVAVDLRYYDGDYERTSYYGDPNANHYVLSVSYALRGNGPRTSR
jgi:uncharacterized protein (TIGR02001 family)